MINEEYIRNERVQYLGMAVAVSRKVWHMFYKSTKLFAIMRKNILEEIIKNVIFYIEVY